MTESQPAMDCESLIQFWSNVPQRPPYVHPDDELALRNLDIKLEDYGIYADLYPQPWVGPPKTAVAFVLQLNPGYSDQEHKIEAADADFQSAVRENLRADLPNIFFDDRFRTHPGYKWVKQRLRGTGTPEVLSRKLAQLELFPYHSKTFTTIKPRVRRVLLELPSVQLMRRFLKTCLVPRSLRHECGIVALRSAAEWGVSDLPQSDCLVIYRGWECQNGRCTPAMRGGQLIQRLLGQN